MKIDSWKTHSLWAVGLVAAFAIGSYSQSNSLDHSETSNNSRDSSTNHRSYLRDSSAAESQGLSLRARDSTSPIKTAFDLKILSSSDPDFLAKTAFSNPNPVTRRLAFSRLLESVTVENAAQIREQLNSLGARGQELNDFNYTWGALAGKEAFDTAALGNKRDLEALITGWAAVDPSGAMAMLGELPEDLIEQKARLESGLVSGLADRDPDQAAEYVSTLAAAGNKNAARLMSSVVGEVLRQDGHEGASVWVEGLEDGPLKGAAMDRVAGRYVRNNPEAASRWIEQFAGEEYAAEAIREVGSEWAERDPNSAVGWLDRLPDGSGQKAALNSAFDDWEDKDPVAAGTYLVNMPHSPKRDSAISGFASGLARQDPETAMAWALDISNPVLRNQSLTKTGQIFFRYNPEGAKAWLATSGLPAKLQAEIQAPRRNRRR